MYNNVLLIHPSDRPAYSYAIVLDFKYTAVREERHFKRQRGSNLVTQSKNSVLDVRPHE